MDVVGGRERWRAEEDDERDIMDDCLMNVGFSVQRVST